jgi:hypothetical protein
MKVYLKGFEGSSTLREQMANAKSLDEMLNVLEFAGE